ncbi:MAG: GT2 family glycosyltransferase [Planctomycetota bacterium]|jgi:GT2 family glycosyltransferase
MELSIVIPSWNTVGLLRACLFSIERAEKPETEIIVVDNASGDASADMVAEEFPNVKLKRNDANEGFAIGCNQGIAMATGDYILLLNADTEIIGNGLVEMVDYLREHPEYGGVAPQLVHPDGSIQTACMRFPNFWTPFFFGTPFERWFPKSPELVRYFMMEWDHGDERDIDQPPAACLTVRREVVDQVGVFDEQLWLFFNDVDLSLRMSQAGWKTRYLESVKVLHHEGASTKKFGSFIPEWHRNRLAYFRKHHGPLAGPWVKFCVATSMLDFSVTQGWRRLRGKSYEDPRPMLRSFANFLRQ